MRTKMRNFWRDVSGGAHVVLTRLLDRQVAAATTAIGLARSAIIGEIDSSQARRRMADVEHEGDEARKTLVEELAVSIVTPLDREDLFRLSRSIDDILDNLRDFVRELNVYGVSGTECCSLLDALESGILELGTSIRQIRSDAPGTVRHALAAKKGCNDVRRSFQEAMDGLLVGEVTTGMLRSRELLRRLDVVGLRLGEAVDVLLDAAMKRTL